MNDKGSDTGTGHTFNKTLQILVIILFINTDPALYSNGYIGCANHGFAAIGNDFGLGHQTSTKAAGLNPITGAAHV